MMWFFVVAAVFFLIGFGLGIHTEKQNHASPVRRVDPEHPSAIRFR